MGLYYIANYSGEIHNVFIDPAHIGAIPDDDTGAMRVLQYFVHSSMVGVNASIYHSSEYAKLTDTQWENFRKEIIKSCEEVDAKNSKQLTELKAL